MFMASIKQNKEFYGNPWTLPEGFYFQNFIDAWNTAKMGDYMLNSVLVTEMCIRDSIKELITDGVTVEIRQVPSDSVIYAKDVL